MLPRPQIYAPPKVWSLDSRINSATDFLILFKLLRWTGWRTDNQSYWQVWVWSLPGHLHKSSSRLRMYVSVWSISWYQYVGPIRNQYSVENRPPPHSEDFRTSNSSMPCIWIREITNTDAVTVTFLTLLPYLCNWHRYDTAWHIMYMTWLTPILHGHIMTGTDMSDTDDFKFNIILYTDLYTSSFSRILSLNQATDGGSLKQFYGSLSLSLSLSLSRSLACHHLMSIQISRPLFLQQSLFNSCSWLGCNGVTANARFFAEWRITNMGMTLLEFSQNGSWDLTYFDYPQYSPPLRCLYFLSIM